MQAVHKDGSFEITIGNELAEARSVQHDIEELLRRQNFEDRDVWGIKLALEEAIINAMKHGNQMDPTKKITIRYLVEHPCCQITVTDQGPGFDPGDVPDPLAVENLERPSGRGLLLIRHYMTEVQFCPPGNQVTMRKICQCSCNGNGTAVH